MATPLTAFNFRIQVDFTQPLVTGVFSQDITKSVGGGQKFSQGAGARAVDTFVSGVLAIPASGNVSIDLTDASYTYSDSTTGQLKNPANETVGFARVKGIFAMLDPTGYTTPSLDCTLGGGTAAVCTFKSDIVSDGTGAARVGTERCDATGWAVTNSSADKIWIFNNQSHVAHVTIAVSGATA